MERNVMGELNVYRGSGAKPNFSEIARRHGMDRHTVAKYWREGESAADGRSARGSAFDPLEEVIRAKAQLPGMTKWIGYTDVDSSGRGAGDGRAVYEGPQAPEAFHRRVQEADSRPPQRRQAQARGHGRARPRKSTVERRVKSINATGSPRAADNRTPEQNRILELERENRRLRMEVDVLKQAAPICARK